MKPARRRDCSFAFFTDGPDGAVLTPGFITRL
jgi:hypothetical protein